MSKRVTNLRPGGNLDPLAAFSGCKGITGDHSKAMISAMWELERALEQPNPEAKDFERWALLATVEAAVRDAASGANFNPTNHDLRLEHARVIFDAMLEEWRVIRDALANGRMRSLKTFDRLTEIQGFVCDVIEQAMEPCL